MYNVQKVQLYKKKNIKADNTVLCDFSFKKNVDQFKKKKSTLSALSL